MTLHRTLAAVAIILGTLALFARDPIATPQKVGAEQLATWIKDRKPGLRVVDLRSKEEFAFYHIPTSQHVASLAPANDADTIVFVSDGDKVQIPQTRGHVYVLHGGFDAWREQVMHPRKPTAISRYFGGERRGGC